MRLGTIRASYCWTTMLSSLRMIYEALVIYCIFLRLAPKINLIKWGAMISYQKLWELHHWSQHTSLRGFALSYKIAPQRFWAPSGLCLVSLGLLCFLSSKIIHSFMVSALVSSCFARPYISYCNQFHRHLFFSFRQSLHNPFSWAVWVSLFQNRMDCSLFYSIPLHS